MRYIPAVLAVALLAVLPAGAAHAETAPSPAATPDLSVGLVDVPEAAKTDPRARAYIVDNINPGASIERRIKVQNGSASSQSVRLYAGAAHISGNSFVAEDIGSENELSGWTSVKDSELELPAGQTAEVPVTVTIPADAAEGEYYGVIWAQIQSTPGAGEATQVSRVGIREYISVGTGQGPAAGFTVDSLTAGRDADGKPRVSAKVTNTGARALDVNGALSLSNGPAGISAGPFPLSSGVTIAPGGTADVAVDLDAALPTGSWDAALVVRSGSLSEEVKATITIPEAGEQTVAPSDNSMAMLIVEAGVAVLILLLAGTIITVRRRGKK